DRELGANHLLARHRASWRKAVIPQASVATQQSLYARRQRRGETVRWRSMEAARAPQKKLAMAPNVTERMMLSVALPWRKQRLSRQRAMNSLNSTNMRRQSPSTRLQ